MKKMSLHGPNMLELVKNEIELMSSFSHDNIVRLVAADYVNTSNGKVAVVIMEYCSGGHLLGMIQEASKLKRTLDEKKACQIFHNILSAVVVLHTHEPPIAHRDLKVCILLFSSIDYH